MRKRSFSKILIPTLLLLIYFWMALSASLKNSLAFDEIIHITGGYAYWSTEDYRLNQGNGVFPQKFAAIPLLFQNIQLPPLNQSSPWDRDLWNIGYRFFDLMGTRVHQVIFSARFMICLLAALLGGIIFFWSSRIFGLAGGTLSLVLYVLCPSFLAHGTLVTNDLSIALFLNASTLCIWMLLHRISIVSLVLCSTALAGAFLSKFSSIIIIPVAVVLIGIRLVSKRPLQIVIGKDRKEVVGLVRSLLVLAGTALLLVLMVTILIWSLYGFRYAAIPGAEQPETRRDWENLIGITGQVGQVVDVARKHKVLPEAYLYGFLAQSKGIKLRRSFLNGHYSITGFPDFFLFCVLYKTPLTLFAILILALYAIGKGTSERQERWFESQNSLLPLIVFFVIYWIFAATASLNIGHRHILPIYPPIFILSGAAASWILHKHRLFRPLLVGLIAFSVYESFRVRPHYLSYFNSLGGGTKNAYKHLVDSSLDWGQDLPALGNWLLNNAHGERSVYLSYFGTADPADYGVHAKRLPGFPDVEETRQKWIKPEGGIYCISATMLQSLYNSAIGPWNKLYEDEYQKHLLAGLKKVEHFGNIGRFNQLQLARLCAYLRKREPDGYAGYSILIYRLSNREVQKALYGVPAELYGDIRVRGISNNTRGINP